MATLIDCYSNVNKSTKVVLELNLIRSSRLDYCSEREDYLNWIPFEFKFQVGENEIYKYPKEFGATCSLLELKNFIQGVEQLSARIKAVMPTSEEVWHEVRQFEFYTLETYFGITLVDGLDGLIAMTVWINTNLCGDGGEGGYERGFRCTVSLADVEIFNDELRAQLKSLLNK